MKTTLKNLGLGLIILTGGGSSVAGTYVEGDSRILTLSERIDLTGPVFEKIYDSLDVEPIEVSGCDPTSESGGCVNPFLDKVVQRNAFACVKPLDSRTQFGCSAGGDFSKDIRFTSSGAVLNLGGVLSKSSIKKINDALVDAYGQPSITTEDGTGTLVCSSKDNCSVSVTLPKIGCEGLAAPKLDILASSLVVEGDDARTFFDNLDLPVQDRAGTQVKGFRSGETIFECTKNADRYSCLFDDKSVGPLTYTTIDFAQAAKSQPEVRAALEALNDKIANIGFEPHRFYQNSSKNFSFLCSTYLNDTLSCQIQVDAYASCIE
jgi:hypothetical protein